MKSSKKKEKSLNKKIKTILKKYNKPGVSVVAVRNSFPPVFEYYAGKGADVHGDSWDVKDDSIFLIASVSKLVTVTTLLHCIEKVNRKRKRNKKALLTIDSYIGEFLPFEIKNPNAPDHKITFEQILNHTSGIVDNFDLEALVYTCNGDSPISLGEFSKWYLSGVAKGEKGHTVPGHPNVPFYDEKNFYPPGIFSYSNAAYTLVGYMVECLCEKELGIKQTMWEYCNKNILKPLEIGVEGKYAGRFIYSQLAVSKSKMARPNQSQPFFSFPGYSNGGFRCTGLALGKILSMLINQGTYQDGDKKVKILSKEMMNRITNFAGRNAPWQTLCTYGFGLRTDLVSPEKPNAPLSPKMPQPRMAIGHTGGEVGVATCLYWVNNPDDASKSIGVLVLTNTDWPANPENPGTPIEVTMAVLDHFQNK